MSLAAQPSCVGWRAGGAGGGVRERRVWCGMRGLVCVPCGRQEGAVERLCVLGGGHLLHTWSKKQNAWIKS